MAAPRRTPLRVAAQGEKKPARKRAQSVATAAASGDHRALLVAMRERVATAVSDPECPPRDLAALTRRLQDIAKEIDALDLRAKQEGDEGGESNSDEAWNEDAI